MAKAGANNAVEIRADRRPRVGSGARLRRAWLSAIAVVLLAGCGARDIDRTYGKRRGAEGEASVNGTAVLARMFELAGHQVRTRTHLSPRIDESDVIVWFPDEFLPPGTRPQEFLEEWLYQGQGKTLIYVGRDYDAAIDYWERMLHEAPPEQSIEVWRRLARARATHGRARAVIARAEVPLASPSPAVDASARDGKAKAMPAPATRTSTQAGASEQNTCRWFRIRSDRGRRYVGRRDESPTLLHGPWSEDSRFRSADLDLVLDARLEPRQTPVHDDYGGRLSAEIWLSAGDDPLVWRITSPSWDDGQIIVIPNGSFLLNLPLVEHGHRRLAGKLIDACGVAGGKVIFLESGASGVPVLDEEPGTRYPTGFEAFTVWPLNAIILHFVVLGVIVLACRWTVFGRARELPPRPVSDFGRHIDALGELLARTQDRSYAENRLAEYRRQTGIEHPVSDPSQAGKPQTSGTE